jgi:DNA-binding CsgD family transcriptional regulator
MLIRVRPVARLDVVGEGPYRLVKKPAPKEDSLPIDNGPLTERQTAIIGHVRAGLRYRKIAEQIGISEVLVRREVVAITRKLRATTLQQAIGIYATAMAYRQVALMLDNASRAHPEEDGTAEDHVDHVLTGMAEVCRTAAARLLPQ